jgi:hypothetical protein
VTAIERNAPFILRELRKDGVCWQARRGADRGRLEVVAIVPPSAAPTVVSALTDGELRELLADAPAMPDARWICVECGTANEPSRRWCRVCSAHGGAA